MDQPHYSNKSAETQPPRKQPRRLCNGFKMFLAALSFSYICKALAGTIMKSSITQIERRFDIPSSIAGLVDGGFEIGNLLVIVFVSYFGSKLHRPKLIGIGCFVMGVGGILTALPHFFMGYYRYSTEMDTNLSDNSTLTCLANRTSSLTGASPEILGKGCGKESKSYTWIYVLMGNMLRGIGESPIGPLGISYIDDFAKEGHSSVYIGTLNTVAMIGPILGFVMSSIFAQMYVDIGYVDLSTSRITPKDARWVGAWWLSFLISGLLSIISSIPFFFLPKTPQKPQKKRKGSPSLHVLQTDEEKNQRANLTKQKPVLRQIWLGDTQNEEKKLQNFFLDTESFLQSLKSILTNHLYVIYLILTVIQISSFIGSFTYVFKYVEQQYGQTASQANFLLGLITLPTMSTGMFLGGYIIKKFKFTLVGIAKFAFFTSSASYLFQLLYFPLICENKSVAGLTLTYDGMKPVDSHKDVPLSSCNSYCSCDENQWEPVCGENGVTYLSPCLAGCKSSSGSKKPNNGTLYPSRWSPECKSLRPFRECPRDTCKKKYYFYMAMQVLNSFSLALGSTSFILLLVRNVKPELKSLAMGFHSLMVRTLGGILAPIYYGALIDRACMKWSVTSCGGRGACRIYNSILFGTAYLGLNTSLKSVVLVLYVVLIYAMKKKYEGKDTKTLENGEKVPDETNPASSNENAYYCVPSAGENRETPM